jgi:hypothetical protein
MVFYYYLSILLIDKNVVFLDCKHVSIEIDLSSKIESFETIRNKDSSNETLIIVSIMTFLLVLLSYFSPLTCLIVHVLYKTYLSKQTDRIQYKTDLSINLKPF